MRRRNLLQTWRTRLSLARARLATAAGLKSGGFFIPYKYSAQLVAPATPYPAVLEIFRKSDAAFRQIVEDIETHIPAFADFGRDDRDPSWAHTMFPALDGAVAYAMVHAARPARILEIGSGNSTRFMARALRDGDIACRVTCIDPAPRMPVAPLGVEWIPRILSEDDAGICADFARDDILFIDSSHIMLPGMDVDIQFNRIFPALPAGVLVHLHDVFLPFDYPPALRKWGFSEQSALIGWIVTGHFDVVFPAHYVRRVHSDLVDARLGHFGPLARPGAGSLWLRRSDRVPGRNERRATG